MAISVRGFNFSKRVNSTSRPTIEDGEQYLCNFKMPTSITNPTILVTGWDVTYNYATIAGDIERWYFVKDCRIVGNELFEIDLEVDVLATARTSLQSFEAYVLRSAIDSDYTITDSYYPTTAGSSRLSNSAEFVPLTSPGFILSVVGNDADAISNYSGVAKYYMLNETAMANLVKYIFDQDNYSDEITDQVVKTFFNPSQYIISCMYCPFASSALGDTIKLGWWDTGIVATEVSPTVPLELSGCTITIPRADSRADHYLNYEPYSNYRMYIPYLGMIDLSAHMLKGQTSLTISGVMDYPTGNLQLRINGDTGRLIGTYECNACPSLPMAQSSMELNTFSAITGGLSILTDWIGGSFGGQVDDIADTITSAQRQISVNGNAGQMSQKTFTRNAFIYLDYFSQVEKDNSEHGSPLCQTVTLSSVWGGYCKCLQAHYQNTRLTKPEIEQIDSYLNGGVFLE